MISKTLTVVNPSGLHLRPAGVLSQTAMKFKCDVLIECGEKRIIAKSVLNVMAAGIKSGTEITLICDGEDEAAAMETISQAMRSSFQARCDLDFERRSRRRFRERRRLLFAWQKVRAERRIGREPRLFLPLSGKKGIAFHTAMC